jgi:hypothetical protein
MLLLGLASKLDLDLVTIAQLGLDQVTIAHLFLCTYSSLLVYQISHLMVCSMAKRVLPCNRVL